MIDNIIKCEEKFLLLFCKKKRFSKNLIKYIDEVVPDMYDHNFFRHNKNTTLQEAIKAYDYQIDNGYDYLKFMAEEKLDKKIIKTLLLQESITLTMLYDNKTNKFKINDKVEIRDISFKDLNRIELKHYAKLFGEAFILRRNAEFINVADNNSNFRYIGAYINDKLVGDCHYYKCGQYTCLDSLLVDNRYRHKYVASTLIKYVIDSNKNVYLHASNDENSKDIYKKLGFKTVGKTYEYFREL